MKKTIFYLGIILVISAIACTSPEDLSSLKPYLKKSVEWNFTDLNRQMPLNIYYLEDSTGSEAKDVILYIKNKAWERIGQEEDLSILQDYINRKFIVLTLDLGNDSKASSPLIDNDINKLHKAIFGTGTPSILKDVRLNPKQFRCFILPEGYRVATDLTFWEFDKHGVHGSLEYIMKTYNEEIVPKVKGLKPAANPAEMVDRKGNPFDYKIKMDIVYPSRAKKKLPAFVYSETQASRNSHHTYLFQLRGYTYVIMGHCFNPCVTHYWHFLNFTLDHWNGLACYTAGMRYIYKNADQYGIDTDHIGMMGISKGQYAVTRLSDPNNASGIESKKFNGFPDGTPAPQPWPGFSSKIHAGWQGMGMGLFESEYITSDYAPTILACGENDRDVITKEGNVQFGKVLDEKNVNHVDLFMEGLGHSLSLGYDKRLGVNRYQLVLDFFDRYLKPEAKLPPVVLITTPKDSAENVSPSAEISVQFAPVIDENTILSGKAVKVVKLSDQTEVSGSWNVSHRGTKYVFNPAQPLEKEQYQIRVTTAVKDNEGNSLERNRNYQFKVSGQ